MIFGPKQDEKLPRTVVHDMTPQGEAAARAGRSCIELCDWLLIAVYILGGVSEFFVIWLVVAKGGDVLAFLTTLGFAVGGTLGAIILPSASVHLEESRPFEAAVARIAWLFLILAGSMAAVLFAFQPDAIWTVAIGSSSPERSQTLAAIAAIVSNILAGALGRVRQVTLLEGYRLWEGLVRPSPAPMEPEKPAEAAPIITPEEAFQMWAESHLQLDSESTVASADCRVSYRQMCVRSGMPLLGDGAFFRRLADEAAAEPLKVFPLKSSNSHYRGWKLLKSAEPSGSITPIPERPAA